MKKIISIFIISVCTLIISVSNADEVSTAANKSDVNSEVNLEMTPELQYMVEMQSPTVNTVSVFNASGRGLLRGCANIVTCPAELVRGFTYEYTSRKWYVAAGSSFLAAILGTAARLFAGAGDIITLGVYGNVDLVKGFPDYVWQGAWIYKPPLAVPTTRTSGTAAPVKPDKDILPGSKARVIEAREQENIDFYESKLPEGSGY